MTETERAPIDWSKPLETEDGRKVHHVGETIDGFHMLEIEANGDGRYFYATWRPDDEYAHYWFTDGDNDRIRNVAPPAPEGWRVRNEDGSENQIFATEAAALSAFWRRFDAWRRKMPVFEKAGGDDDLE